ncbi:hypothetical protein [Sphingobacterium gobiense]|uniref:Uncharacterized protein n=1 Tax=Sphingobacterium gobiense TaxID=1382456 RepID=A0A2S9JG31_9SPHI|nr:hypothetical protein [Sphingobacterium gobiense]PRD51903.1 hypothetical protein C5749_16515 [Sphingobacterium gobiense]
MKAKKQTKTNALIPQADTTEAIAWNESVKLAAMLLHWNIADGSFDLIRLMHMHQVWSAQRILKQDDQLLAQLLDQWPIADTAPRIWACFHIGPYALISRALIKKGIGIAVLLKDDVYEEQHQVYVKHFRSYFGHDPRSSELQFIRSGSKASLIQLKRCLADGLHVVCFVDGQEGGTSVKSRATIQLYNTEIDVRLGVAMLSHWTKVPVRPLVLTVQGEELHVRSPADYKVEAYEDYTSLLQNCYNIIATLTPQELVQWDVVPTLFDTLMPGRPTEESKATLFKNALWIPIFVRGQHILVDLRSGVGVSISRSEHQLIYGYIQEIMASF